MSFSHRHLTCSPFFAHCRFTTKAAFTLIFYLSLHILLLPQSDVYAKAQTKADGGYENEENAKIW